MKENTKLLEQIRILAKHHDVPCISGETAQVIAQHLMKYKPVHCLEIGTAIGYSTQVIGSIIDKWQGQLVSFEISHPSYMSALRFQYQSTLSNITLYHANFLKVPLDRLVTPPLDFIFIDGAKAHYHLFLEKILPYCSPTATIICDDVVAYKDKMEEFFRLLDDRQLTYTRHEAEEGDGLLILTLSK